MMYLYKCKSCGKSEAIHKLVEVVADSGRKKWVHRFTCSWCYAVHDVQPGLTLPKSKLVKS